MSKYQSIQMLSRNQLGWVWVAYWRLWPVLMRIKFKQFFNVNDWLMKKITVAQNLPPSGIDVSSVASQVHEAVRLAARLHVLLASCLPKAIVLADILTARGMPASVVIGVSKADGRLSSHAWVEVDGKMVAEPESVGDNFTPLNR
ncbi:MAG: hypothetical protein ACJAQ6_000295 [Arenicella sp.]|jgi:hypothetical protein